MLGWLQGDADVTAADDRPKTGHQTSRLQDENARLREEIARLKAKAAKAQSAASSAKVGTAVGSSCAARKQHEGGGASPAKSRGATAAKSSRDLPAATASAPTVQTSKYAPGDVLSVTGLKKAEMNGRLAHVVAYNAERDRYSCIIEGARYLLPESRLRRTPRGSTAAQKGLPVHMTAKAKRTARIRTVRTVGPGHQTPGEQAHVVPILQPGTGVREDRHLKDPMPWREHGVSAL